MPTGHCQLITVVNTLKSQIRWRLEGPCVQGKESPERTRYCHCCLVADQRSSVAGDGSQTARRPARPPDRHHRHRQVSSLRRRRRRGGKHGRQKKNAHHSPRWVSTANTAAFHGQEYIHWLRKLAGHASIKVHHSKSLGRGVEAHNVCFFSPCTGA